MEIRPDGRELRPKCESKPVVTSTSMRRPRERQYVFLSAEVVVTESPKAFNRIALQAGIAVPVLYYGVQLLAAPFYPGYSFITNVASDLGSPTSTVPAIFKSACL